VTKKKLWVIASALGVSSMAALPAITAQAGPYPPGNGMTVKVTSQGGHSYKIDVSGAQPGCTLRVVSGKVKVNDPNLVDAKGNATLTVDIGDKTGTRVILVKTVAGKGSCTKKETFPTKVATTNYTLGTTSAGGDASTTAGKKITIKALGWDPSSKVAITITDDKSTIVRKTSRTPNSSGNVFWKVTAPPAGTYAVVATQGTQTKYFVLTVNRKKHHH
jgi:hypothetical protein